DYPGRIMANRSIGWRARPTAGRLVLLSLLVATLGWGTYALAASWWYQRERDRAGREIAAGRYEAALARLERLAAHRPATAEVESSLGGCAASLGRVDTALAAWARVPRGSPYAARAALERARLALDHGRLAIAEESLAPLLRDPGEVGEQAAR